MHLEYVSTRVTLCFKGINDSVGAEVSADGTVSVFPGCHVFWGVRRKQL